MKKCSGYAKIAENWWSMSEEIKKIKEKYIKKLDNLSISNENILLEKVTQHLNAISQCVADMDNGGIKKVRKLLQEFLETTKDIK